MSARGWAGAVIPYSPLSSGGGAESGGVGSGGLLGSLWSLVLPYSPLGAVLPSATTARRPMTARVLLRSRVVGAVSLTPPPL